MNSVLRFDGVGKSYRSGDFWRPLRARALDNVSFELARGEVFGLVGLNGAGKSTLMKMAVGLLHPDTGSVRLFGLDPREPAARRTLGYLPELPWFPAYLSPWEILRYYGRLQDWGGSALDARIAEVLELVGLSGRAKEPIRRFSKGMQQRVGLAQALLHDPDLLFLDEPMSGLDPKGMKEMRDVILGLRAAGKTIFFNSHVLAEVERICDRVGLIHRGRLILVAGVAELVSRYQSSVTLGLEGGEELAAPLRELGFACVRESRVWAVSVPNARLAEALTALGRMGGRPPSVLSSGSPLETAFLEAIAGEEVHA
jgi:ABC-2 type transport system ATP-binding protein